MPQIIYEINTRVWIKQFRGSNTKLLEVPSKYWESLANKGVKLIWLMGIWETVPASVEKYCFTESLKQEYNNALSDWNTADVIGSPYAIDNYIPNPSLATTDELLKFKNNLNELGLKLILDFIPNHFNSQTSLLKTNPEIFLKANHELLTKESDVLFEADDRNVYAHGKDPNFPAWEDTIQVNYFSAEARSFMINALKSVAKFCDGVRCDMAMLPLNNEFRNTWQSVLAATGAETPESEFWSDAISSVKNSNPNFIFIAEAYWNLEWHLQQLGFNFTYDKRLLERLQYGDAESILLHLKADDEFQKKSLRFIENHDEQRAITALGKDRSYMAAVVISTINGLTLFNDGQFEGKRVKLPVQLGREPVEEIDNETKEFYSQLLSIISDDVFIKGDWSLLDPKELEHDFSFKNIFAWQWTFGDELRIVVINYSDNPSYCRLKFDVICDSSKITLVDLLNNNEYKRDVGEINSEGLFIHLEAYKAHIFKLVC